jgi:hypothetical protein
MFFDPNLYIFMEGNLVLLLVIYVNDVMITLSHTTNITWLWSSVKVLT